jgi:signal transduction histidine kinase
LEIDIEDGIITDTDNELLSLVWNNFISNAIKFTPEGGKIHVSLKKTEGKTGKSPLIEFAVSDCGPGMDDFTRKHVFEKFFQGDNTNSSQGNGLGLALAARVATICNARIGVQSELGKGSRFFFQFSS